MASPSPKRKIEILAISRVDKDRRGSNTDKAVVEEKKSNGLFEGFFERGKCGGVTDVFGQGITEGGAGSGEGPVLPRLL